MCVVIVVQVILDIFIFFILRYFWLKEYMIHKNQLLKYSNNAKGRNMIEYLCAAVLIPMAVWGWLMMTRGENVFSRRRRY